MAAPSTPHNPPSSRPTPLKRRSFQNLASFLWILILLWSALVAIIWFGDIGEAELRRWFGGVQSTAPDERIRYPDLFAALNFILSVGDTIWIILGAVNVYVSLATRDGLAATRRRALTSLVVFWIVSAASARTDWPLGPIHYTERLGMKLGGVPLGWLILLFTLVFGARELASRLARSASHTVVALLTGILTAAASFPLAIVGWKIRAWLIIYPGQVPAPVVPPIHYYVTFFAMGYLTAWFCRERNVAASATPLGTPAAIFLIFVAFLGALAGASL